MKGSLLPEFEKVAYELRVPGDNEKSLENFDTYIGQAKTQWGYHIILVYGRV
jgi:parvulin-like peptidyl-prolyl isomerase